MKSKRPRTKEQDTSYMYMQRHRVELGRVKLRSQEGREVVDEDGEDVHIHHAHVEPQQPQMTHQMAADTTDPHANSAGPVGPVGMLNEPLNGIDKGVEEGDRKVEEEDEKGRRASESAAPSSNDDSGDEDVRYVTTTLHPALPPPPPVHPKQLDDVNSARACKMAAQRMCGDAMNDPGSEMDAPGSQPPSVWLKGEKDKALSLYVEADHVEADDDNAKTVNATVKEDQDDQIPPRDPVGTQDGDMRCPNEPTEPPDEEEGARGGNGELRRIKMVEDVELKESR
ncbi:hypothetical protein PAXINDRAFT_11980 [Paxillus involutus ATCC 200175]|uniref:Uncharacterized protein n=1 Tax=Paxillus involutus ATCC 200175 TaxID=664439 RepID=A0A0C9TH92_PAXIN|nr:hypothetical protein PAXINDRAFT_11980 [Paxillus involutus ATCC 200175]